MCVRGSFRDDVVDGVGVKCVRWRWVGADCVVGWVSWEIRWDVRGD